MRVPSVTIWPLKCGHGTTEHNFVEILEPDEVLLKTVQEEALGISSFREGYPSTFSNGCGVV